MEANLYYDCKGERWSILDFHSRISFTTERGLKQSIRRKINKDIENGNLRRFFGMGAKVSVNVFCKELGFISHLLQHVLVYIKTGLIYNN